MTHWRTKPKDYTGMRAGYLTALRFSHHERSKNGASKRYWLFLCVCGKQKAFRPTDVIGRRAEIKSCGCRANEGRSAAQALPEPKAREKFRVYKSAAKKNKREFKLSFNTFKSLISKPCAYCGDNNQLSGLDRIDNNLGYVTHNCNPCCTKCNLFKHAHTLSDFLTHVQRIAEYQQNKRKGPQ